MTEITCKNDLYAHLNNELTNPETGETRGTLKRVRAGYDFAEFETPSGKTVRRDVSEILSALDNGFTFN